MLEDPASSNRRSHFRRGDCAVIRTSKSITLSSRVTLRRGGCESTVIPIGGASPHRSLKPLDSGCQIGIRKRRPGRPTFSGGEKDPKVKTPEKALASRKS